MAERAPLPWHSVGNSWQYTTVYDVNGNHVFRHDLEDWSDLTEENQDQIEDEQAKLVTFIVKAANNHEMLVQALRDVTNASNDPYEVATKALARLNADVGSAGGQS